MIAPLLGRIPRAGWVFGGPRRYPGCYDRGAVAAAGPLPRLRADCGALSGRKWIRCTHRDIGFFKRDEVRTRPRGKYDRSGAAKARKTTWPKFKEGRFGRGTPPEAPTWTTARGLRFTGPRPHTPYPGNDYPPNGSPGALTEGGGFRVRGTNPPAREKK